MIGLGSPHLELECQVKAFEDARIHRQLAMGRQQEPVRRPGRPWSPYFLLALKSLALFQILRMALDGGV
jgi:hypothetical protein